MRSSLLLFAVLALTASCNRPKCCEIVDTSIAIKYRSSSSNDWLRANSVTTDNLENYSLCSGQKTRVYQGNYDYPKSLRLYREPDTARTTLLVYPNDCSPTTPESVTLLEFPDHSVDTLRCSFDHQNGNEVCTAVRYNGKLRWSNQQGGPRTFVITK